MNSCCIEIQSVSPNLENEDLYKHSQLNYLINLNWLNASIEALNIFKKSGGQ